MLRNRTLKGSGRDGARRVNRGVNTIRICSCLSLQHKEVIIYYVFVAAAAAVVVLVWFP